MAFSFSNWFKKPASEGTDTAVSSEAPPAPPPTTRFPAAPPAPPNTTPIPRRALKTVMPNSVRPVSLREGIARPGVNPVVAPSAVSLRPGPSAVPPSPTRAISFPSIVPVASSPAAPAPAEKAAPAPSDPTPNFNPAPDAPVVIPLGEFVDRLPGNLLRPGASVDREREVVFQSADLYSDLTRGRASIPLSAVQTACPDLFARPVSPTEDVEIALPLQRVIEQLAGTFQARPDQVPEEDVAEIETPFLQVALEDSMRLPKPPKPVAPPAARPAAVASAPAPVPPPVVAPVPLPPRNPAAKNSTIAGNEAATIRALTPRQTPAAPHAPAQAPAAPAAPGPNRDGVAAISPASKRPPSTVRASVAGGKIRLSGPAISSRSIAPAAANSTPAPLAPSAPPPLVKPVPSAAAAQTAAGLPAQKKTARIQIPAIALRPAGASPAPAAAPRPTTSPTAPPARSLSFPEPLVSFRASPGDGPAAAPGSPGQPPLPPRPGIAPRPAGGPGADFPPPMMAFAPVAFTPPPMAPPPAPEPTPTVAEEDDTRIVLTLAPILRTLSDGMFADGRDGYSAAEQVADDAKVELPLGFITTQLAQGRVAVPRAMFVAAMPAEYRHLMPVEGEPAEVLIPLQEVFQNLPTGALSRRRDQVVDEVGPEIPTPFSQKAQEDAQRLAPASPPETEPEPEPEPVAMLAEPVVAPEPAPAAVAEPEAEEANDAPAAREETPLTEPAPDPEAGSALATAETALTEPAMEVADAPEMEIFVPAAPTPELAAAEAEEFNLEPVAAEDNDGEKLETPVAPDVTEEIPARAEEAAMEPAATATEPVLAENTETAPVANEASDETVAENFAPPVVAEAPAAEAAAEEEPVRVPEFDHAAARLEPALPATNGQHPHGEPVAAAPDAPTAPASLEEEIQDTLRSIFMVDDDLDARKVVRLAAALPGLKACAVMFGDGLKLAGDLDDGISASEGFCAMTPPFFNRARAYAAELGLGEAQCVSLQTERALLSFFMAGNICLSVQHANGRPFLPGVREKMLAATTQLARMYATPVSASR